MSAMEDANALDAAGAAVAEAINGAVQNAIAQLNSVSAALENAKTAAENSTNAAAQYLGEGHMGTGAIVGAAAAVVERVEQVRGLLSQFEIEASSITGAGGELQSMFGAAAQALRGGR